MFATPVPGYLHPEGWVRPPGNLDFVVTRGCAAHLRTGVGCALDIGNARQGAPVYAMAAGRVTSRYVQNTPGQVGHGALIMRVTHAGRLDAGGYWSTGYAHLQSFSVGLGTIVAKGQQIGVLGATGYGITGPHLHTDGKLHTTQFPNGVAKDLWPLLDQNIPQPTPPAGGTDMLQGTNPKQLNNKVCTILGASTRFRAAPAVGTTPVLAVYGAGTAFTPDWEVTGAAVGTAGAQWYGGWGQTAKGLEFGYLHTSVVSPLVPFEQSGVTQDQLDAAVKAAKHAASEAHLGAATSVATNFPE